MLNTVKQGLRTHLQRSRTTYRKPSAEKVGTLIRVVARRRQAVSMLSKDETKHGGKYCITKTYLEMPIGLRWKREPLDGAVTPCDNNVSFCHD